MPNQEHNRLTEKLRAYWESLRGARPFPEEREIDPEAIKEIWDSCFLVRTINFEVDRLGYRYDYLGKELIEAFGSDVTNQEISAKLVDPLSPPLVLGFASVVATGEPVIEEAEFTNSQNMLIKYRSCILPLGNPTDGVDYILGGMKWKSF